MIRRGIVVAALLSLAGGAASSTAFGIGADVAYQDSTAYSNYGNVGGIRAYYLASLTCNLGDTTLAWQNQGTPVLFVEMFRLYNGRLEQIGLGWGKYACCAASGSGCPTTCNTSSPGVGLRAGCRDSYGASYNGTQTRLGPRSGVNAWTGAVGPVPTGANTAISRRLQVRQEDLTTANARYFVQGTYVATDDAVARNHWNNSSYKPVSINPTTFDMGTITGTGMGMQLGRPAIYAWQDHGLGNNIPDPGVRVGVGDVPDEGRFYAASKVTDNGNGTWHYEYAVENLNSDRSGGSVSILIPAGASVTNVGFKDVDYHSGEPFDNADWTFQNAGGALRWSSPQTFAQNPNSNALRFGTMYNFWFDANQPPAGGVATLGLFKPGTPTSLNAAGISMPGIPCTGDVDGDRTVSIQDLAALLARFGQSQPGIIGDLNGDAVVDISDLSILLAAFGMSCP